MANLPLMTVNYAYMQCENGALQSYSNGEMRGSLF